MVPLITNYAQFFISTTMPAITSITNVGTNSWNILFNAYHLLVTGNIIILSGFTDLANSWNGTFSVTVTSLNQVTINGPTDAPGTIGVATYQSSTKNLIDRGSQAGVIPNTSDVRSGVTYNAGNNIGTCAVPLASQVSIGVAVGATVGTAVLTAANVQQAVIPLL